MKKDNNIKYLTAGLGINAITLLLSVNREIFPSLGCWFYITGTCVGSALLVVYAVKNIKAKKRNQE